MITALHLRRFATTRYHSDPINATSPKQPLVLIEDSTVYGACHLAEWHGVQSRMSEQEARSRCPEAHFAHAQIERDAEVLLNILEVLSQHTEHIEPITRPQAPVFLVEMPVQRRMDLIELAQLMGNEVRTISHQTPSISIAPTVFTAKTVASSLQSGYVRYITSEQTVDMLRNYPLTVLPLTDGTINRMHKLGITTVGHFADLPSKTIFTQFGREGQVAYDLAYGRDSTVVRPRFASPHIDIPFVFDEPIRYEQPLLNALNLLSEKVVDELISHRVAIAGAWIHVITADGGRQERRRTLLVPIRTQAEIFSVARGLLNQIRLKQGVTEIRLMANPLISLAEGATQTTFLDRLSSFASFQQWVPRFLERHGRNTLYQYRWRSKRENVPQEEQFELISF